jgi:serine/threonine protein kinase
VHEVQLSLLLGTTHVNVVRPHELLLTRTHVVLATAYERGGTLAAYCERHRVDEATACYFFRQLCSALAFCHAQGVAFRDVKLENVLLDDAQPPRSAELLL